MCGWLGCGAGAAEGEGVRGTEERLEGVRMNV